MPATATKVDAQTQALTNPYRPANIEAHNANMAERKATRDQRKAEMIKCLDPDYAAQHEARKPIYEWSIDCTYQRPNEKGKIKSHTEKATVTARDEREAWAKFCDHVGLMIGPHSCERTITKQQKVN